MCDTHGHIRIHTHARTQSKSNRVSLLILTEAQTNVFICSFPLEIRSTQSGQPAEGEVRLTLQMAALFTSQFNSQCFCSVSEAGLSMEIMEREGEQRPQTHKHTLNNDAPGEKRDGGSSPSGAAI